jgi:hypothetical protein
LGAILVNTLALERWQLAKMATVAIACATVGNALLFSLSRLCRREGKRGNSGLARTEFSNTRRQKRWEENGYDGKQQLAAFHGSPPFGKATLWFKYAPSALQSRLSYQLSAITPV